MGESHCDPCGELVVGVGGAEVTREGVIAHVLRVTHLARAEQRVEPERCAKLGLRRARRSAPADGRFADEVRVQMSQPDRQDAKGCVYLARQAIPARTLASMG
jgi:hypothetical protein